MVVNLDVQKTNPQSIDNETGNWFVFFVSKTIHACVSPAPMSQEPSFL